MTQSWEIENFLEAADGRLHIDGVPADELAREYGTPLFVFSERRIRRNVARLLRAQELIDGSLKICYAAKANSTMAILRAVKNAGSDIEVNSGGELWKALEIGFSPEQIIFNGTSKEAWELENAINAGIYAIQADSLYEISLIDEIAGRLRKRANVSLRLVPEIETKTHSGLQTALLTSKFGMMPEEAFAAFRKYGSSEHVNLTGIHLHIGSQNPESEPYSAALRMLFESLVRIFNETGQTLSHLNLGGGFPVNYLRDRAAASGFPHEQRQMLSAEFDPAVAVQAAWNSAANAAAESGASDLLQGITLLLEPGRSIISDAGVCLTTVRNKKERPISGPTDQASTARDTWLLTDAGFNVLLSMETYKWYYQLIAASRAGEPHDTPYKVAGPLCDGGDVYFDIEGALRLPDHRLLPRDIRPGDVLALLNCGAYSLSQASQYNARFLPPVILVRENGDAELVRVRDGFKDLVASDVW
jgi:diaminopimelate decarboxylase